MTDPKVLHLISSSGVLGAEQVLLQISGHLRKAEIELTVGVFENERNPSLDLAVAADERGLDVQIFPCEGRFDRKTVGLIRSYLRRNRVNILHSHNYKSNFFARLAISNRDVRWVVTNHGRRSGTKLVLYALLDALVVRKADRVVAVSDTIARQLIRRGIHKDVLRVIDNGADWERFSARGASRSGRASLGIQADAVVIGTVGALTKEKGHKYLLEAAGEVAQRFSEAVFLFVGDGPERKSLEKSSRKLGLGERVVLAGARSDIPDVLSTLDVFVMPSLQEGLPMALLEAGAARIPIIATRVGGVPRVVEDGVSGILVPPKQPEAIAKAVIRMLSDREEASAMAKEAFKRIKHNFASEKMAKRYLSLYNELLSSPRGAVR